MSGEIGDLFKPHTQRFGVSFTNGDLKERLRALEKIETKYCPNCKNRIRKVVEEKNCMDIFFKKNRKCWSGVRCTKFKRFKNG